MSPARPPAIRRFLSNHTTLQGCLPVFMSSSERAINCKLLSPLAGHKSATAAARIGFVFLRTMRNLDLTRLSPPSPTPPPSPSPSPSPYPFPSPTPYPSLSRCPSPPPPLCPSPCPPPPPPPPTSPSPPVRIHAADRARSAGRKVELSSPL